MKMNPRFIHSLDVAIKIAGLLYSAMMMLFGLFSGADSAGLLANSPNALPGFILLLAAVGAWFWPKRAAMLIISWAVGMGAFFSVWHYLILLFLVVLLPLVWGGSLLLLSCFRR